jgi:hypothetical protein
LCATLRSFNQPIEMKQFFFLLPFLVFFSCNYNDDATKLSSRDSLIARFLTLTDSLPGIDTIDGSRRVLLAFHQNDTSYLRRVVEQVQDLMKYREEMVRNPSCAEPSGIESYNFKEAYRFEYAAAFCDQSVNFTVGERNDSFILFGYHYKLVYNLDSCLSSMKIEKMLNGKQWDTIKKSLRIADFWGLKPRNYNSGFDGSSLTVTGYQRPVNAFQGQYSKVYRRSAEETMLGELFKKILEMSGCKATCFYYY